MTETITVQDLISSKESQKSNGVQLTGVLFMICKSSSLETGSVQLVDVETKQHIPCLVNQFIPSYHKAKVIIKEWNYIFDLNNGYKHLEFLVDSIFTKNSQESILRKHLLSQDNFFKSLSNSFYVPSNSLCCKKDQKISLAGKIHSISPLFAQPGINPHFYIQLERDNCCVTIRFSEKYYRYFMIGYFYCFLKLEIIREDGNNIFLFNENSVTCTITETQYKNITIEPDNFKYPLTILNVQQPIQFTGSITKVIDPLFGIFELENQLILCLFYYMDYSPKKPYRLDTKICISNFHTTKIESNQSNHLLNLWDIKVNSPMLIACQKTKIEVKYFPNHLIISNEDMESIEFKHLVYLDIIENQVNFLQFIQQLEIFASFKYKFSMINNADELFKIFKNICKFVFDHLEQCSINFKRYFEHEFECNIVTFDKNIVLYSYPNLKNVKSYLEDKLVSYELNLIGDSHSFEEDRVPIEYSLFDNEFYIIGQVNIKEDGRLILLDDSIDILLNTAQYIELNGIYIFKRAQYFSEDLYIIDPITNENLNMKYNYISCNDGDLFTLYQPDLPILQIQQDINSINIEYFICNELVTNEKSFIIIHVIDVLPMELVIDKEEEYMESRIVVEVYPLFGPEKDIISKNASRKVILVTNKPNKSLKFNRLLQLDKWYFVVGLDLNNIDSTYFLSEELNEICPILISSKDIENAIHIKPIGIPSVQITKQVYNVSRFLMDDLCPDPIYKEKGSFFYNKPIDVRGIIVSKHFSEGFGESVVSSKRSKNLFHLYGIGTGKPNRILQVELREIGGLDTIKIYIDSLGQQYPLGLLPGAHVIFRNLIRKHQSKSLYQFHCISSNITTIEIDTTYRENMISINTENIPIIEISELQKELIDNVEKENTVFKLYCYIQFIISLQFKWLCKECGSTVRNGDCYSMCINSKHIFIASAYVKLSDGEANANINVDGENLVFKLLRLAKKQSETLKKAVLNFGEVNYKEWKNLDFNSKQEKIGYDLEDMCTNAKSKGSFWIYAKRQFTKKDSNDDKFQNLKEFTFYNSIRTWEFKKVKLKLVDIEEIDQVNFAYEYLLKEPHDYMNENE